MRAFRPRRGAFRLRALPPPLLAAGLLAGCDSISLEPISEPPPTRRASIHEDDRDIDLSHGVAFAVECIDSCDGPCRGPKVRSGDESVVAVHRAYHFAGVARGEDVEEHNPATFVLVGVSPGSTRITVESNCTDDSYAVTVHP